MIHLCRCHLFTAILTIANIALEMACFLAENMLRLVQFICSNRIRLSIRWTLVSFIHRYGERNNFLCVLWTMLQYQELLLINFQWAQVVLACHGKYSLDMTGRNCLRRTTYVDCSLLSFHYDIWIEVSVSSIWLLVPLVKHLPQNNSLKRLCHFWLTYQFWLGQKRHVR